jgi:hypothetical protein
MDQYLGQQEAEGQMPSLRTQADRAGQGEGMKPTEAINVLFYDIQCKERNYADKAIKICEALDMAMEALKRSMESTYKIIRQDKIGSRVVKTEVVATDLTEEAARNIIVELNSLDDWDSYSMEKEEQDLTYIEE